jgi:hypothetical protein
MYKFTTLIHTNIRHLLHNVYTRAADYAGRAAPSKMGQNQKNRSKERFLILPSAAHKGAGLLRTHNAHSATAHPYQLLRHLDYVPGTSLNQLLSAYSHFNWRKTNQLLTSTHYATIHNFRSTFIKKFLPRILIRARRGVKSFASSLFFDKTMTPTYFAQLTIFRPAIFLKCFSLLVTIE